MILFWRNSVSLFSPKPRKEEFEAVALPHVNDLFRTAVRLIGDEARAEDVIQDVFLTAWDRFHRFEAGTNCRAWLFQILFHCLRHYRRKWLNRREVRDPEEVLEWVAAGPEVASALTDEDVLAALESVPAEYREVVLLVDVEEFSYKEAAGILGVPAGTVMSRLSRGRALLRQRLAPVARSYGISREAREGKRA